MMPARRCCLFLLALTLLARPSLAQYAEIPWPLPNGARSFFGFNSEEPILAATQIGRRLFIGGRFTDLGTPTGGAAVVDTLGVLRPQAFPVFGGSVSQIAADGAGGWFAAGTFSSVGGRPIAGFARVASDRTVDERFRVVVNGTIRRLAVAHSRVYLLGDFTSVNGAVRRGLAALDATTGAVSGWGAGFDPQGRPLTALALSSIGVYVAGMRPDLSRPFGDRLWGLDATNGRVLFEKATGWVGALAASSARVYVGGAGYQRPVWAVDPVTGDDTAWQPDMQFLFQSGTYGDYTAIGAMLLDGGRLYFGGRFLSTTGRRNLTAVDATTGERVPWRPVAQGITSALERVGPYISAVTTGTGGALEVFDANAGATQTFTPGVVGTIATVAAVPEGLVVGGSFSGAGGVPRSRLASMDIDTHALEPWTSAMVFTDPDEQVAELATDGTWLFARTEGGYGQLAARVAKIDPASGAVVAERTLQAGQGAMRVAGGELVIGMSGGGAGTSLGVITIADWSYRALPATFTGEGGLSVAVDGNTIYAGGQFTAVNGQSRVSLAAFDMTTGALLPWHPVVDAAPAVVRAAGGRVWIGGEFSKVNGQRRRGLAEVDAVTGAVTSWNPDVLGVGEGGYSSGGIREFAIGPDGYLYAAIGSPPYLSYALTGRPTVGGQATGFTVAFSASTGQRLPWTPTRAGLMAVLPDCLVTFGGCLPRSPAVPTGLQVAQANGATTLSWSLPVSSARTGVRMEVSAVEGRPPLLTVDLPANQTSFTAAAPPGSYAVRVRALEGLVASMPTPDVSFAAGPPAPGAPLDATVVADGPRVAFRWMPPSTGAPQQYLLEGGTSEGKNDLGTLTLPGASTSVTFDGPVGMYFARLVAVNGGARSGPGRELLIDVRPRGTCTAVVPSGLTASVAGRVVTLSWTPAPDASDVPPTIVAGTAPRATDIGYFEAPAYASSFSIAAPPGTYYVRLTAGCFSPNISNEVMVVVP